MGRRVEPCGTLHHKCRYISMIADKQLIGWIWYAFILYFSGFLKAVNEYYFMLASIKHYRSANQMPFVTSEAVVWRSSVVKVYSQISQIMHSRQEMLVLLNGISLTQLVNIFKQQLLSIIRREANGVFKC